MAILLGGIAFNDNLCPKFYKILKGIGSILHGRRLMSVALEDIPATILKKCNQVNAKAKAPLREAIIVGNTLIESLSYIIDKENSDNKVLLGQVLDEIFLDLHISVTLAMGEQHKAACVLLRTFVETALYIIYFIDHPLDARIWANSTGNSKKQYDMSFSETLEEAYDLNYIYAASGSTPDVTELNDKKEKLKKNYRLLSERVHGKYAFLQAVANDESKILHGFSHIAISSISSLLWLSIARTKYKEMVLQTIPAVGGNL